MREVDRARQYAEEIADEVDERRNPVNLTERIEVLTRERDLRSEALLAVEWSQTATGCCPWCRRARTNQRGHAPTCLRQRALGLTPGTEVKHDAGA